eukprot:7306059-Alexandrium_andersonii.AAC.1
MEKVNTMLRVSSSMATESGDKDSSFRLNRIAHAVVALSERRNSLPKLLGKKLRTFVEAFD